MADAPVVPRPRLPDQVVLQLLAAVADATFPPGTRLPSEAVLSDWAGVSRLTLREGVKVLRDKGVLRVEQGRGTFVNPPESWSVLDPALVASRSALEGGAAATAQKVTEARRIVEVGAAGLAARRRTDAHLVLLGSTIERMLEAHERDDVRAFSAADIEFHDAVMLAAGNAFLAGLLQPVMALLQQVRVSTSVERDMRVVAVGAHREILAAITARDEACAKDRMGRHMEQTHRVIERVATSVESLPVSTAQDHETRSNPRRDRSE